MTDMNFGHIIQYATLLSLLMGGLGVVVAVLNHREQVKTQIFLAMSAQYDELLKNSSAAFWLSVPVGTELPERTDDLKHLNVAILHSGFINLSSILRTSHTKTNVGVDVPFR